MGGAAAGCDPLAFLPRLALAGRAVLAFLLGKLSFCCTLRRNDLVALPEAAAPAGAVNQATEQLHDSLHLAGDSASAADCGGGPSLQVQADMRISTAA